MGGGFSPDRKLSAQRNDDLIVCLVILKAEFVNNQLTDVEVINAIELKIDADFHSFEIPSGGYPSSQWHLLSCAEDQLRMAFLDAIKRDAVDEYMRWSGFHVYALRNAIEKIRTAKHCASNSDIPRNINGDNYIRAARLLEASVKYYGAQKIFSSLKGGGAQLKIESGTVLLSHAQGVEARYAAYELFQHGSNQISFIPPLIKWIRGDRPVTIEIIVNTVKHLKNKLIYKYHAPLATGLVVERNELLQADQLIPDRWRFPWGGVAETLSLTNALHIRCLYHFVAVHFYSQKVSLKGFGVESLVLQITKQQLLADMSLFTEISKDKIRAFIKFLTYGNLSRTPDPALQPLIPVGDELLIPVLTYMHSNHQRNLLSLQARICKEDFDAQSGHFEIEMAKSLSDKIRAKWPLVETNCTVKDSNGKREADLIIVDEGSSTIFLAEMRWILQPGDIREIINKNAECRKKVQQCLGLINFFKKSPDAFLGKIFPGDLPRPVLGQWTVVGVVLIQGYSGIASSEPSIPVVERTVFDTALAEFSSLKLMHDWLASLAWLPEKSVNFEDGEIVEEYDGVAFKQPGINVLGTSRQYLDAVIKSAHGAQAMSEN